MSRSRSVALFPPPPPAPGIVATWAAVARRRWPVGAGLFLATAGLAAVLVFLARPVWRAEATMRLGAPPPVGGISPAGGGSPAGLFSLFQQMTGDPFANELELLSSRTVVEGVVSDNALNVALVAPRGWHRDLFFTRLSAGRETGQAVFEAEWRPDGRIRVRRTAPSDSLVGDFAAGRPASFGGITAEFRPRRAGMPASVELRTLPFGDAVRRTRGRLLAARKRREANLVRLSYDDPDPGLALAVLGSAAWRYSALRTELQRRESGQTTDSLRVVAEQTLDELRREEDALERFQRDARLVAPEAQSTAFVERQAEVAVALERARSELVRTDDVLQRLERSPDPGAGWAGLIAHPTFLENQTLGELLGSLVRLQQERIELGGRRTAEDRQVQALDRQIAYLDGSLRSLVRQYRDGVASEVQILERQRGELDAALVRAPADIIELGRRQRALRQLSEVYLFTDQRLRQESLRGAVSYATVQVVDPPQVLFKPVWPRRTLGLGVGVLLALAFGALGMALTERADGSIRSTREVRELAGAPVLAVLSAEAGGGVRLSPRERRALLQRRGGKGTSDRVLLAPVDDPAVAEAVARALAPAPLPETVRVGPGEAGDAAPAPPAVEVGPVLDHYAAAAELAEAVEAGTEVLLVVRCGVTRREHVARAAALLREAGAGAAGVVVVASDPRAAEQAWR
ncbi:MAG TPA: hypothetical protein VHG28_07665 [Longimicrobiaceae bacterium]|nr:hypothetical protein [Longimicrobiaceae bacterium]